jgi:hypothetical protein
MGGRALRVAAPTRLVGLRRCNRARRGYRRRLRHGPLVVRPQQVASHVWARRGPRPPLIHTTSPTRPRGRGVWAARAPSTLDIPPGPRRAHSHRPSDSRAPTTGVGVYPRAKVRGTRPATCFLDPAGIKRNTGHLQRLRWPFTWSRPMPAEPKPAAGYGSAPRKGGSRGRGVRVRPYASAPGEGGVRVESGSGLPLEAWWNATPKRRPPGSAPPLPGGHSCMRLRRGR